MIASRITDDTLELLRSSFSGRRACRMPPMPFSAAAFMAWDLRRAFQSTVVIVTDTMKTQDEMLRNLSAFADERDAPRLLSYPAWEDTGPNERSCSSDIAGERINTLDRLRSHKPALVATCVQALMQPAPAPDAVLNGFRRLAVEREEDLQSLEQFLEQAGYEFMPEVQCRGQAARRGGLLDVWPPNEPDPIRIEFFGSMVETIRSFDPADQRSITRRIETAIPPADERKLMRQDKHAATTFMAHLDRAVYLWFESDPASGPAGGDGSILEHAEAYEDAAPSPADLFPQTIRFNEVLEIIANNPGADQCMIGLNLTYSGSRPEHAETDPGFQILPCLKTARGSLFEPDIMAEQRREFLKEMSDKARNGMDVHFFFHTPGALDRFRETYGKMPFHFHIGPVSDGFINLPMRMAVVGEPLLTGGQKRLRGRYESDAGRRPARRRTGETITDWTSIRPGDFVVHVEHGIGKYLGIYEIDFNGRSMETLAVEYADGAKLYVPVTESHLLSRYIGSGKTPAKPHKLGGARWTREKNAAKRAVMDLAASMLQIQAMRESMEGFAFPADNEWQNDFEAAFPYQETPDQIQAIEQVKLDMESTRPMDRLICGDVGYGKTEVAMRAAFKAVTAGKQVAILVPTTVLAQQHFEVFLERMGAYPFHIELLCRLLTRAQQDRAAKRIATGSADIAIGTHRLLQKDVRFKDLGLVIIDEEQRFGVAHKEQLKHMRQLVDVLTLTATPIPRTLYLSLTGARDISMIQTAPEERTAVETMVAPREDAVVAEAVRRELNRGGQVYYLHNRIATIERVGQWLQSLAPNARIAVAHGKTPTAKLSSLMHEFEQGGFDLLLCTTIIQSGLDIPNVNTILIDRADRFGMADLYQLRGRVGRSSRKAYAYLLLPAHGTILDESRKRIQAIIQHSGLGSGFRLAVRDLEIRGAGNLLGRSQSGHIAAIGFDLYCQLLKRTVAMLAGKSKDSQPPIVDVEVRLDFIHISHNAPDPDSTAYLPHSYAEDEQMRLDLYRKIASATGLEDIQALQEELKDRFGPLPDPLERLLKIAEIRIIAAAKNISAIESDNGRIMLKRDGNYIMPNRRFPRLHSKRAGERLDEIIRLLKQPDAH